MASAAKTLRVSFVQFRGTPYEVGRAQAVAFAATRRGKAFLRKKVRLPVWFNIRTEERAFGAYAPALWEEIVGIADGAEYPDGASGCLFRQRRFADADRRLFVGHEQQRVWPEL